MKKALKITLIVILCLIILIGLAVAIKFYVNKRIIKKINKSVEIYSSMKSYAIKTDEVVTAGNQKSSTSSFYCQTKDEAVKRLVTVTFNGKARKLLQFFNDEQNEMFINTGESKVYIKDTNDIPSKIKIEGISEYEVDDSFNLLSMSSIITKASVNGEKCYKITIFNNFYEHTSIYYSEATGLKMKQVDCTKSQKTIKTYNYQFEDFPESAFNKPDIEDYTIIENN